MLSLKKAGAILLTGRIKQRLGSNRVLVESDDGKLRVLETREVLDTNLHGTWHMMHAAAQTWREAGRGGSVVNVSLHVTDMEGAVHSDSATIVVFVPTLDLTATEGGDTITVQNLLVDNNLYVASLEAIGIDILRKVCTFADKRKTVGVQNRIEAVFLNREISQG